MFYFLRKNNEFQVQIQISNQLNLTEQLDFFKRILNFSVLDLSTDTDTLSAQINQTSGEDKTAIKHQLLKQREELAAQAQKAIELITKQNVNELKLYNEPNDQIKMSGEVLNLLLGVSGGWKEFRSRLNYEIVDTLKTFNADTIPAKTLQKLSTLVENDDFKMAATQNYNQASQGISQWILSVYRMRLIAAQLNDLDTYGPGSSYATLSEYLVKNAFYMFCWPAYYDQKLSAESSDIVVDGEILASLIGEKFLSMSDYLGKYGEVISADGYKSFCENFAVAEAARGNFFLCGYKRNYLITDVAWFASIIQRMHESEGSSETEAECGVLRSFVKESVPIWDKARFVKTIFGDLAPSNAEVLVNRLADLTIFKIESQLILPLFLLSDESPKDLVRFFLITCYLSFFRISVLIV